MGNYMSSLLPNGKTGSRKNLTGNSNLDQVAIKVGGQTLSMTATTDLDVDKYNRASLKQSSIILSCQRVSRPKATINIIFFVSLVKKPASLHENFP